MLKAGVIIMKVYVRTYKNMLIIVACLSCSAMALLYANAAQTAQTRECLAAWRPAAKPGAAASHSPAEFSSSNELAVLVRSNESAVLGGSGGAAKTGPLHSYYSRGWNSGGQWWQLSGISTLGYKSIELSFATRGSGTGPRNFKLEYSLDGHEWLPLVDSGNASISYAVDADNKFHHHGPYLLSAGVDSLGELYIRFLNTDTESVLGGATSSSGTNYIADIVITGMADDP